MTVESLLTLARGQLGYVEQPPGSNRTKYGQWYGMDGAAWCGMFVSWVADLSGNGAVIPRYAYTPAGAAWFQSQRGWNGSRPVAGDIVFYDVSGMGRISHTGIVESVRADGSWYSIEGNTNGAGGRAGGEVRRQLRSTVGTSRGGFGRPNWPALAGSSGSAYPGRLIRRGQVSDAVRAIQGALNRLLTANGRPRIDQDGDFGPATLAAVRWFQTLQGLEVDGIVGPATWNALHP